MEIQKPLKILCLSFWTPPLVRTRAIIIGKFIPHWLGQGIKPVIITYENGGNWDPGVPVYRISQFKLGPFLSKVPLLRSFFKYWYFEKLFRQAKKLIKNYDLDLVFSLSNPQESNILGAMLKRRLGIKFISHFSDPWYDNPYKKFEGWAARKVLRLEKYIVECSDRVIFLNDQARDLVLKKYPASWRGKGLVIPLCYDQNDYARVEKKNTDQFVFAYVGTFYQKRNPEILFKSIKSILEKHPDLLKKIRLNLVLSTSADWGYDIKNVRELISRYNLSSLVNIKTDVDHKESLRCMSLADCLIVIDADFDVSPFLPLKLIDYAGSRNNILAITPKGSVVEEFLKNFGGRSFSYNETEQLENYLLGLIYGREKFLLNEDFLKNYEISNTTKKLINEFKAVLSE